MNIHYGVLAQKGLHVGIAIGSTKNYIQLPSTFKSNYFAYWGVSGISTLATIDYGLTDNFSASFTVQNNQYGFTASTIGFETQQVGNTKYFSGNTEKLYAGYLNYALVGKHRLNIIGKRIYLNQSFGLSIMPIGSKYENIANGPNVGFGSGSYSKGTIYSNNNLNLVSVLGSVGAEIRFLKNKYFTFDVKYSSGLKEAFYSTNLINEPDTTYTLRIGNNGTSASVMLGIKIPIILRRKKIDTSSIHENDLDDYYLEDETNDTLPIKNKENVKNKKIDSHLPNRRYLLIGSSARIHSQDGIILYPWYNIGGSLRIYYFPTSKVGIGVISNATYKNDLYGKNSLIAYGPSVRYYLFNTSSNLFLVTSFLGGMEHFIKGKKFDFKIESGIGFQRRISNKLNFETVANINQSHYDGTGFNLHLGLNYYLAKK